MPFCWSDDILFPRFEFTDFWEATLADLRELVDAKERWEFDIDDFFLLEDERWDRREWFEWRETWDATERGDERSPDLSEPERCDPSARDSNCSWNERADNVDRRDETELDRLGEIESSLDNCDFVEAADTVDNWDPTEYASCDATDRFLLLAFADWDADTAVPDWREVTEPDPDDLRLSCERFTLLPTLLAEDIEVVADRKDLSAADDLREAFIV